MMRCLALLWLVLGIRAQDPLPASDWITTGTDCTRFAAGDIDGDGFADVLTINGNRDLCVAPSVRGWKAAGWRVLASDLDPLATGLDVVRTADGVRVVVVERQRVVVVPLREGKAGEPIVADSVPEPTPAPAVAALSGPPYDPHARELARFTSAYSARGGTQAWAVFATDKPHPHHVVRTAVIAGDDPLDTDADGSSDADEAALGTDPRDRDSDGDGLLDGWEVHGLPGERVADLGPRIARFDAQASGAERDRQLDPRRRDVIVNISYFEQVDRARFEAELPRIQGVYRRLALANRDGSTGIWLHFRDGGPLVPAADQHMPWWDVGNKHFAAAERGLMHWLQVTPWGGGQSSQTGDMGGAGNNWAVFAHELGHQLSLSHTGDSAPGWCPLYTSLMNYAYNYSFDGDGSKPHFSNGELRAAVLEERSLRERLPFPIADVAFLAKPPFRFTLEDAGDGTTRIDWNHDGVFADGEVIADINYGGSTHAGIRKTHELIGSAPSLATIADRCFLAAATHKQTAVSVKAHRGGDLWTNGTELASSATRADPVLIGGEASGVLLVRRFDAWAMAEVRPGADDDAPPLVSALRTLDGLTAADLSGIRIGARVLLLARRDDGALAWRWLTPETGAFGAPGELALTSSVPPALAIDPADGALVVVAAARHPQHGPFCMQVASLRVDGDDVVETPPQWTHGGKLCHCTSRPVAVFAGTDGAPQLTIFHTGWSDAGGTWTGWRTTRVRNTDLDGGWLTCQLYDEWTRSRVALGFADSARGACYAFRWDPGDHGEWKINTMFVAHGGYGIDDQPMRDFDDGAQIGLWGIRHSILTMRTDAELDSAAGERHTRQR
jgi:hypothetical protein